VYQPAARLVNRARARPLVFKCEAWQLRQRLLFAAVHSNNITWANV